MITNEKIEQNKQEFISLLRAIKREGARIEELISKLENSDFFTAPASTRYHASYKGGLCQHCLNVYNNLMMLNESKNIGVDNDSIIIVSLLHDLSKMNFFEISYRNKKQYSEYGTKRDAGGNYDWVTEQSYSVISEENRFIYGNHETTSEFMVRTFIPLTVEESVAILHHHGGTGWDSNPDNTPQVFNRYTLPVLLHCADLIATYEDEKN